MAKKKGLGRGLEALLGAGAVGPAVEGSAPARPGADAVRDIPVDLIQRGRFQPRMRMDEDALEELAASVRAQGIIQPVVLREVARGRYELIAGERRWRAAQRADLAVVPAVVRQLDDESALAMALVENIQREDLNPIEEALALARLIDEFELTHEAAAEAVGRSRAGVSNLLRLLELGPEARELLETGSIEMGHARALLGLSGSVQAAVARDVAARGLSVRETEALVRRTAPGKSGRPPRKRSESPADPNLRRLQERLSEHLGAMVRIEHRDRGNGRLVIDYGSVEELQGVLERMGGAGDDPD